MYILPNRLSRTDDQNRPLNIPGAPIPIAGSEVGLHEFKMLNDANLDCAKNVLAAGSASPPNLDGAFFVPHNGTPDFDPSTTSFLCTDVALKDLPRRRQPARDAHASISELEIARQCWL
jgi:hypothetical protein